MMLKEEKVNMSRQREFDFVKMFAILFMVIIHVYEEVTPLDYTVMCSTPFSVILEFLAGPLAAPVFMFSLGLGLAYSRHRDPNEFIKRGVRMFIGAYVFNLARYVLPYLISCGFKDLDPEELIYSSFLVDILQFAGLAFILTGLLKKWNVPVLGVMGIAIIMQGAGLIISKLINFEESTLASYLFAPLVNTGEPSYFPLFQWYVYPALGLTFAKYLRHIEDTDRLYKFTFGIGACLMFAFCATLYYIDYDVRNLFALADDVYYDQSLLHTLFNLCCILMELSLVHFAMKTKLFKKLQGLAAFMSGSLNQIYIVQWMIIGWIEYLVFDENLPFVWVIPMGIAITAISSLMVFAYKKLKKPA